MSTLRISWSGLRRYEDCKQHHLRVITGHQTPVQDTRNFLPGTVADRIMRAWLDSSDPRPGQMVAMVPEYMERFTTPEVDGGSGEGVIKWRGDKQRDKALVTNFVRETVQRLEPWLFENVVPFEYHPELRFTTTVGIPYLDGRIVGVELIGGIDIAVRRATDDYRLYDLKTTKNEDYIKKTLGQGVFYDVAFGNFIGDHSQPTKFGFVAPGLKQIYHPALITQDDRRALLERVIQMAHGMWRKEWAPRAKNSGMVSCSQCPVRHACDKFKVEAASTDELGRRRASFMGTAARKAAALES